MGLFEPHGRYRHCDGEAGLSEGKLLGIARRAAPRAPMETLDRAAVTLEGGVADDSRGIVRPGGKARRQVSLMERADWEDATRALGISLDWWMRRANLLVDGIDLPQRPGAVIRIGGSVRLEVTTECNPCSRMEEIAPGLEAALTPDWRGGALARVLSGGEIRVGDPVTIEEPT